MASDVRDVAHALAWYQLEYAMLELPEGALRERLRLQFAKTIPEFDDLDLLQIIGISQIGRLRYSPKEAMSEEVPTQDLAEILTYKGGADLFAHLLERFAVYSGISGMQPKVLVREIKPPQKVTHQGATHIVKSFDAREYPELAATNSSAPKAQRPLASQHRAFSSRRIGSSWLRIASISSPTVPISASKTFAFLMGGARMVATMVPTKALPGA